MLNETASSQIANLIASRNLFLSLIVGWVLAGGLWMFITLLVFAAAKLKLKCAAKAEDASTFAFYGCLVLALVMGVFTYYKTGYSIPAANTATIIRAASLPAKKRLILISNNGLVNVSERASVVNPEGELIVFYRDTATIPLSKFADVWQLAGGTTVRLDPAVFAPPKKSEDGK